MATYQYGPHEKFLTQITSGDTVKLEFCLFDSTTPTTPETSVAFGSATVTYCKPGEAAFSAFPTFDTNNWAELGNGWYQLVIRGSDANELALLDTIGPIKFNVAVSGAVCPPISRTIVAATGSPALAAVRAILALPAAAPDAATGLPVSDAGGLDLDTLLARLDATVGSRGTADPGDQMDLVNAPNGTAITAIQANLATSANQTTILNRLGGWAGTGVNTVLGAFKAALSKAATIPTDIGGTFDPATDSTEAIRDTAPLGTAMRGTDDAALASAWTGTRAGYLDNLNVGGNVASSAEVTAIQNNTRAVRVVPPVLERPDAGSTAYRIELLLYDETGGMEAPDAAPTISVVNQAGTSRDVSLDATTMTLVSTGRYRSTYTVASDHAIEELVVAFSVIEGGATRIFANPSYVVDTTAVDFTAADRTKLELLATDYTTARAAKIDNLDVAVSSRGTSTYAGGAVASVTAGVTLADGAITAAKFAAGAIDAAALAADAGVEIGNAVVAINLLTGAVDYHAVAHNTATVGALLSAVRMIVAGTMTAPSATSKAFAEPDGTAGVTQVHAADYTTRNALTRT